MRNRSPSFARRPSLTILSQIALTLSPSAMTAAWRPDFPCWARGGGRDDPPPDLSVRPPEFGLPVIMGTSLIGVGIDGPQVVSQIHEGIVPVPRVPAVESGRNEGEDLLVGYDFPQGKEPVQEEPADVCLYQERWPVVGKGQDRCCSRFSYPGKRDKETLLFREPPPVLRSDNLCSAVQVLCSLVVSKAVPCSQDFREGRAARRNPGNDAMNLG